MSVGMTVAKKSGKQAGSGESRRYGVLVRLSAEVVADAKVIASMRGISMAEYLSERFKPIVKKDLEDEMTRRLKGQK